nr:hypothetical protein [Actinokineospora pegani]
MYALTRAFVGYGPYCKGYSGGELKGAYDAQIAASVVRLKQDMGVAGAFPGDELTPKAFKGLLNMDPYVVVGGGRAVQQWLNGSYVGRRDFFVVGGSRGRGRGRRVRGRRGRRRGACRIRRTAGS